MEVKEALWDGIVDNIRENFIKKIKTCQLFSFEVKVKVIMQGSSVKNLIIGKVSGVYWCDEVCLMLLRG